MKRRQALTLFAAAPFLITGCGDSEHEHDHDHDADHHHDGDTPAGTSTNNEEDGHAEQVDLGSVTIGDYTAKAAHHGYEAGGEGHITLDITGGENAPSAVRVWIGVESAEGSVKKKFDMTKEGDAYHKHDHVEVPTELSADAALWIEIETGDESHTGHLKLTK